MVQQEKDGAILFRDFLRAHGLTLAKAAKDLRISSPSVHAWVVGHARPRTAMREAIEVWTGGAVPADSWKTAEERRLASGIQPVVPFRVASGS